MVLLQKMVLRCLCGYPPEKQRTLELKIILSTENDEEPKKSGYFTKPVRNITVGYIGAIKQLVVHFYPVDVLKDLNVNKSLNFHFDSVIPASLAGVFTYIGLMHLR
jgi:hypothetical protein